MTKFATEHAEALAMVRAEGADVVFVRTVYAPDPGTGQVTPSRIEIRGVALQVGGKPWRFEGGSLVQAAGPMLLFVPEAYGGRVAPQDAVELAGQTFTVESAEPLAPDGVVILQRVQLG
jgi:hypothetical protein